MDAGCVEMGQGYGKGFRSSAGVVERAEADRMTILTPIRCSAWEWKGRGLEGTRYEGTVRLPLASLY